MFDNKNKLNNNCKLFAIIT